ncbi:MAG: hypothetical protein WB579_09220 [Bryobacteraceae bacterium]
MTQIPMVNGNFLEALRVPSISDGDIPRVSVSMDRRVDYYFAYMHGNEEAVKGKFKEELGILAEADARISRLMEKSIFFGDYYESRYPGGLKVASIGYVRKDGGGVDISKEDIEALLRLGDSIRDAYEPKGVMIVWPKLNAFCSASVRG